MKRLSLLCLAALLAACGEGTVETTPVDAGTPATADKNFSSAEATLLDFSFQGELLTTSAWDLNGQVNAQLLYLTGHLNGNRAVARLDKVTLTDVKGEPAGGGLTKVSYVAKVPVAWGSKTNLPTSYRVRLPRDVSYNGQTAFATKYGHACVDAGAHDVDSGSMFYYYRPNATRCQLDAADIVEVTATITPSPENTSGKYPEYHEVWKDGALRVVAIFGKFEDGATTHADAGIEGYDEFVQAMKRELRAAQLTTTPATLPPRVGVETPEVSFEGTLPNGKKVFVTALLVDNVRTAGASFNARYAALSTQADLILYNGHAGLGANVRALASKGDFVAGQYLILFMNGCDTYAYVDGSLAQSRARLNPDDPTGTKYLEFVTNAMPAFFANMSESTMALVSALLKPEAPKTYEQIFRSVSSSQVVVVTGEEDNVFVPGMTPGGAGQANVEGFAGMHEEGSVDADEELRYESPALPAGRYTVTLTGTGDIDLYVKVGAQPTRSVYDCRPYAGDSNERCELTVPAGGKLFVSLFGYAEKSDFVLDVPGTAAPVAAAWAGIDEAFTLAKGAKKTFVAAKLVAGSYTFTLSGTGDADLYVKVGSAPTTSSYDCRPYAGNSTESCTVEVPNDATVHVMVSGYASSSAVRLVGAKK